MAKLKGIKNLTKEINKWTQKNFGIKTVLNEDFCAWCDEFKIGYTLVVCSQDAETFLEDVSMRYPDIKADYFLWCLLHEIGHCMTDEMWSEEEQERFDAELERMTEIENTKDKSYWYYSIPNEFFATRWAGDYMTAHPKKIAKFWNKIQPKILEIYEKNEIEVDN